MKYLKFLFTRKWIGFLLIFAIMNVAITWHIIVDGHRSGTLAAFIITLDIIFVIFSWNEYKLKYPDK